MNSNSSNEDPQRPKLVGSDIPLIKYFRIREKLKNLRNQEIKDTGFAYSNNTEELAHFLFFPGGLLVQHELSLRFEKFQEEIQNQVQGELTRQKIERVILGENREPKPLSAKFDVTEEMISELLVSAMDVAFLGYLSLDDGTNSQNSNFKAMCRSAIVIAWTNFEIMAGMIWENGTRHLTRENRLDVVELVKAMPSLQSIDGIVKAFKFSFGTNSKSFQILRNQKSNYEVLAQCRHIFVHRSGLIDQRFINMVQNSFPDRKWALGERLTLSLQETINLIERSIDVAIELLLAADEDMTESTPLSST